MINIRNQFYKTVLHFENGVKLPITVACKGGEKLPELVEKNRIVYENTQAISSRSPGRVKLTHFTVEGVLPSIQMDEEKYQEELSFCDIVEE